MTDPFAAQVHDALAAATAELEPPDDLAAGIRRELAGGGDPRTGRTGRTGRGGRARRSRRPRGPSRLAAMLVPVAGVLVACAVGLVVLLPSHRSPVGAAPVARPSTPPLATSRGPRSRHRQRPHSARDRARPHARIHPATPATASGTPTSSARSAATSATWTRTSARASTTPAPTRTPPTGRTPTSTRTSPAPAGTGPARPVGTFYIPGGPENGPVISVNVIDDRAGYFVASGAGLACITGPHAPGGLPSGIPVAIFIRTRIPVTRGHRFDYSGPAIADGLSESVKAAVSVRLTARLVASRGGVDAWVLAGSFSSPACAATVRFHGS